MTLFRTRDDLPLILNEIGLTGTWVEVGVERGVYSRVLIKCGKFKKLILIDPWTVDGWFKDTTKEELDKYFSEVCQLQIDPRVTVLRSTSLEMAKIVEEGIDMCFLDARHDYNNFSDDLNVWWPKIKPGGMMAGHDFYMADVKLAVGNFLRRMSITYPLHVACEEQAQSWYVIK